MRTKDARIPLTDRGFLYGDGVFETVRIHRGAPFRLDAHLARLWRGLKTLRLEAPPRLGDVRKGMRALVSASLIKEGLVRITTTAPEGDGEGRVVVTSRDLPTPPREVVLHVATGVRRTPGPLTSCKTLSRIVESVALREAQVHGAFDGVILNDVGRIVETSTRNLFLSAEGQLVTPPASEGEIGRAHV